MIARAIVEKGWDLLELRQSQATLEDVFIDLVTEEADADATEPTSSTENAQTANPEEVGA
jgi:hypothetical protein